MSVWRRKAIECLPELKKEFERPDISIYGVFFELLPCAVESHKNNDIVQLRKIYGFAEWCLSQNEKDLWNAAGVCFYEHLADNKVTLKEMNKWVSNDIYKKVRELLKLRLDEMDFKVLDNSYSDKSR
jgi:hypothetical protein